MCAPSPTFKKMARRQRLFSKRHNTKALRRRSPSAKRARLLSTLLITTGIPEVQLNDDDFAAWMLSLPAASAE